MEIWHRNSFGTTHDLISKGIDLYFSVLKYKKKKKSTEDLAGAVAVWRATLYSCYKTSACDLTATLKWQAVLQKMIDVGFSRENWEVEIVSWETSLWTISYTCMLIDINFFWSLYKTNNPLLL